MAVGLTICQACIEFEIMSAHSHANQVSGQCETKIYFAWPTLCDMSTTVCGERLPGEYMQSLILPVPYMRFMIILLLVYLHLYIIPIYVIAYHL